MPRLLQINVTANQGSHGRIAEDIGLLAMSRGWDSFIAYGRGTPRSSSQLIRIGSKADMYAHGAESRLLDNHGLASRGSTRSLVRTIEEISPDIVHLHNIHGYYVNYPILFDCLRRLGVPVVWTFHDCWPFTGHCANFMAIGCEKWRTGCGSCPRLSAYPASLFADRSAANFQIKKEVFTSLGSRLAIVAVSKFQQRYISDSFLGSCDIRQIYNGVDTAVFRPVCEKDTEPRMVLGVANVWNRDKGLDDMIALSEMLPGDMRVVLAGLLPSQLRRLPAGVTGIAHTEGVAELARLYSRATVFVNPTWEDNFPTTNIEALACGTPVITYRTGGSPEAVDAATGMVVLRGNLAALAGAVKEIASCSTDALREQCRARALALYDKKERYTEYIALYEDLLRTL